LRRTLLLTIAQRTFSRANVGRLTAFALLSGLAFLSASQSHAQILHKKKKINKSTSADNTAEPDKVLYNRALNDIKRGHQEVGRLAMQTLINTYPDSEYLAKAKLAIADSYYKEGGTANMTQAIQGYKDFGIFFPFLSEASYAQLQVANAHYRQMAKPDRDRTEAKLAEEEFQTFLEKYPKDPLAPQAEERLRNVQEIIAEGDYRIGYFYYVKGDQRAAAARLLAITKRYPLFSKSDHALWMLGDIFEKSEHKEIASIYYAQIVRNYPLSGFVPDAKSKLTAFKVPVPQPDQKAMAWMVAEQNAPRQHDSLIKRPLALVRTGPHAELIAAAKTGAPNLQPEADNTSAIDVLSGGNRSQLGGGSGGASTSAVVEVVTPGTGGASSTSDGTASGTEGTQPPAEGSAPPAAGDPNAAGAAPAATPATDANAAANGSTATEAGDAAAKTDAPATASQGTDAAKTDTSDSSNQKESSSKKKKGLRKIVPW
jgi:outer membrane protein assembly factor BamD